MTFLIVSSKNENKNRNKFFVSNNPSQHQPQLNILFDSEQIKNDTMNESISVTDNTYDSDTRTTTKLLKKFNLKINIQDVEPIQTILEQPFKLEFSTKPNDECIDNDGDDEISYISLVCRKTHFL